MDIFGGHSSSYHRSQPCEGLGVEASTPSRGNWVCKGLKTRMDWACSWNSKKATLLESDNIVSLIIINVLHGVSPTPEDKCGVRRGPYTSRTTLAEHPLGI